MATITPFLWFDNGLAQAIARYRSVFDVEVHNEQHIEGGDPTTDKALFFAEFSVLGQRVMAMNAGPMNPQTEAFSFYVRCQGQDEVDRYWDALIADGGTESQCGWLKDPWGVSWQIVPVEMERLFSDPDHAAAGRAREAMFGMQKLIVADLEAAFRGD
jgi:predicted 3-demethylubiquinone-9 3-methyltransferase (glyoxalase superfamily)